ncbi:MAG TPA: SDR family NAD(P)-dependent oxidoreductase [Clostridiaceae bacterium]|jgi:NAD(P)-dependent dehydrogenase (short-subunit alcohol dehydrogenase family)|nr:SDR family NAD(P)-dependent oxidoreductase [Clostridiaceae bacterium]
MNTIVITGASSGIGLETARILTRQGFNVLGVSRSEDNCKKAEENILSENPNARISFFVADLMQQREVVRVAEEIILYLNEHCDGELYALINNAGCVRSWYMTTEEGYEQQFAINHLAGFLLTYKLLPALMKVRGCVIMTGSDSHKGIRVHWSDVMLRRRYNPLTAYKQSKLCNILFAKGLNDRYAAAGIRAYVVDPGLVKTDIGNKETGSLVNFIWTLRKRHGVTPDIPAKTYAFLCEQKNKLEGLYYYLCKEKSYSKQVTSENANRLFELSERLCDISYEKVRMI